MKATNKETLKDENYIIELFKTVLPYKWSILLITFVMVALMKLFLYFVPFTYESFAIMQVKVNNNQIKTEDFLRDSLYSASTVGVKQEMLTLKTYKINKKALEKVDFSIQYFKKENYKFQELYQNSPISVKLRDKENLKTSKEKVLLTPVGKGFVLQTEEFGESEVFAYDSEIETPYFKGTVRKISDFSTPIHIAFNGNSRYIYEEIIRKRLRVTQVDIDANLVKVSFQDTIPERAKAYVNALVDVYINQNLETKDNTNNKVLTFLDTQLASVKEKLEKSESELEKYKSQNRVEPTVKSRDSFEKLSAIDLDLSELALKEKLAKNLITFVRDNRNLDAIAPTLQEFNDQATIRHIDKLGELQQEEDELSIEFTAQYPKLISVRKQMQRIKNKILLNIKNLRSTLITKRKNLETSKEKYETILKELPKKEKNLIHFQRDYDVNSKMYTYLLEKKSENELIKVASTSSYEVVDEAYIPRKPIKPRTLILLITAFVVGFILAVFISLLRALLIDKVATHKEVKLMTKLPIYGVIPLYENAMFSTSRLKEAYHQLATNLQFSKHKDVGSLILVSSNRAREGKTSTTVSLAGVFQNSGYKTIVIDLNMRKPELHSHFGIDQQYSGISTYLSQRDNIGDIIFSTNYPTLDIIPAGPVPPNPSELILSPRLNDLFEILKHKYDYIFIDTASYSEALETLYLMKFTTMNLIVVREKVSKKSTITELETIIQEKGIQNVGLVLKSVIKEKKTGKDLLGNSPIEDQKQHISQTPRILN